MREHKYTCVCGSPWRSERLLDPLKLSYRELGSPCYRCWETKLGPFQEQEVLVTTETSLQPPKLLFLKSKNKK